ncbi:MAG: diguanylate cyclase [Candidatus Gastranaerophilales bacterium]
MFKKISYILGLTIFVMLAFFIVKNADLNTLVNAVENKTFDLRQSILINQKAKMHNENIVIVAIDDASYEYILDNYGEWPLSREMYGRVVDYLQAQNPKSIAFDLMFVKSLKSDKLAEQKLIETFQNYDNVYTAMNFDNQPEDLRIPAELPEKLTIDVENNSDITFDELTFTNCRSIVQGIIDATSNIGIINVSRSDDGVLRKLPLVVKYKDGFYPQLALKVGMNYLGESQDNLVIDKNSAVEINNKKIFLDDDGSAIINWYGPAGTYTQIPLYQLIKKVENKPTKLDYNFEDKIIYFGSTASSLFDIKTVPTSKIMPGVEVQTTYINNLIDGNFIKKASEVTTLCLSLILAFLVIAVVIKINSTFLATLLSVAIYLTYLLVAYQSMKSFDLWLNVTYPLIFTIIAFTLTFVIKYLIKSKDFELQYKLATTDGLTNLYNHRYFQEQMQLQIEQSKRYENNFSLIIIDIDYFKKFNDKYGHQSGDAVLRQVAQVLRKNVRVTDFVCRYGGEEMSIILPNTDKNEAQMTAEKICNLVSQYNFKLIHEKDGNVTISLGVSTFPENGNNAAELIEYADKKLYNAKANGRNQVG